MPDSSDTSDSPSPIKNQQSKIENLDQLLKLVDPPPFFPSCPASAHSRARPARR
jgi:hypothetical protein